VTDHQRLYRRLLLLYPQEFRDDYGDEMRRLFAEQLWDARTAGRRLAITTLWARTLLDIATTAPREHLSRPTLVRQPVDGAVATVRPSRQPRPLRYVVLGLTPLWVFLAGAATAANAPLFKRPPEMAGLPLGVVAAGLAFTLMTFGMVALRLTSSARSAAVAILLFTAPATALLVAAPPVLEALSNLRT